MTLWHDLRDDLRRLEVEAPGALQSYPSLDSERSPDERPSVELAAWASDIAATLHEKWADQVDLQVGAMPFPNIGYRPDPQLTQLDGSPAETIGLSVELTAPLTIRTGRFTTASARITNHSTHAHTLMTNSHLQAALTGKEGDVVGRYTGAQIMPLVTFQVEPGQRQRVPLLVGTDSLVPELGYAVPPGSWSVVVEVETSSGRYLSTPLPCSVTT